MVRTLQNCSLIKKIGKAEQRNGKCLGFIKSDTDDEPFYICKKCKLREDYEDGAE